MAIWVEKKSCTSLFAYSVMVYFNKHECKLKATESTEKKIHEIIHPYCILIGENLLQPVVDDGAFNHLSYRN